MKEDIVNYYYCSAAAGGFAPHPPLIFQSFWHIASKTQQGRTAKAVPAHRRVLVGRVALVPGSDCERAERPSDQRGGLTVITLAAMINAVESGAAGNAAVPLTALDLLSLSLAAPPPLICWSIK